MNGKVTIGLIQMNVEDNREAMLKKALARVDEAIRAGTNIICLPELYPPFFSHGSQRNTMSSSLSRFTRRHLTGSITIQQLSSTRMAQQIPPITRSTSRRTRVFLRKAISIPGIPTRLLSLRSGVLQF